MALQMKENCELSGRPLSRSDEAYVCSYECTFCPECAQWRRHVCPNCQAELLRRPSQKASLAS